VINGEGALVYHGGIDDKPTARLEDLKSARNFVDQALSEISQGKPVSVTTSRAYGCSINMGRLEVGFCQNPPIAPDPRIAPANAPAATSVSPP
jgi:hypothetical protein